MLQAIRIAYSIYSMNQCYDKKAKFFLKEKSVKKPNRLPQDERTNSYRTAGQTIISIGLKFISNIGFDERKRGIKLDFR